MAVQQHNALLLSAPGATLEIGKRATPTPGPGQVLVRNKALALNPADWIMQKTGFILGKYGWPVVLGQDGAGEIAALGEGVTGWKVGDRVFYQSYFLPDRGTFQELTIADAARVARIPDTMSYEEATTLPLAVAAAAVGMYEPPSDKVRDHGQDIGGAGLTPPWETGGRGKYAGKAALILSGSSSVGQFAIQFAKLSGFSPIITTASKHNEVYCKSAGATHVLDYTEVPEAELPGAVADIIGNTPLTFIYDATSPGLHKTGWEMLAPNGTMVIVNPPLDAVIGKQGKYDEKGRRLVWVFGVVNDPDHLEFGAGLYAVLTGMLEKGDIKPNKIETIGHGLEAIPNGLQRLQKGRRGVTLVRHF
ncbi:GroES-like protein [Peniophora sp. CONT]|nr:GroES-like protein [Peniophora sp. CONT]